MRLLYVLAGLAVLAALLAIPAAALNQNVPANDEVGAAPQPSDDDTTDDDAADDDVSPNSALLSSTTYDDGNLNGCGCYR